MGICLPEYLNMFVVMRITITAKILVLVCNLYGQRRINFYF